MREEDERGDMDPHVLTWSVVTYTMFQLKINNCGANVCWWLVGLCTLMLEGYGLGNHCSRG